MRTQTTMLLTTLACLLLNNGAAEAQKAKQPPVKPPAAVKPAVKGTTQMAGDNGKSGITYTIGKGSNAINFTLVRTEYTTRIRLAEAPITANEDEKLLVLHYTVQNPNATPYSFNWATLRFTAVDSENVNREGLGFAAKDGSPENASVDLKPGQKLEVFTAIKLPAKNSVPKLVVQVAEEQPVLRIYLDKSTITGLPAPFADPSDPSGTIARAEVPGVLGTFYPCGSYDVKVISAVYQTERLGEVEPTEEEKLFLVTIEIKNATFQQLDLNWGILSSHVKTADNETIERESLITARRADNISGTLNPGSVYTARFYYKLPKDARASQVAIWESDKSRRFLFDVSGIK